MPAAPSARTAAEETTSPLVSVVIPAFGAEEFIEFTMRSVAAQTHRPMELIVVDDCSPDRTGEIAGRLADELGGPRFSVRVEHHPENSGGAAALHTGFGIARGEYVCWLSADDAFIDPQKTELQLAAFTPGVDIVFDQGAVIGPSPESAVATRAHWCSKLPWLDGVFVRNRSWRQLGLLFSNPINGSSIMIRRTAVQTCGSFDPALRNVDQDSDLWMRYTALGRGFRAAGRTGVFYRIHQGQTTTRIDEVQLGTTLTRVRMLRALSECGFLGKALDRGWPALLTVSWLRYSRRPAVTQTLCILAEGSGCGPVPKALLRHVRKRMVRLGNWNDDALAAARAAAEQSSRSEEFQRFLKRLDEQGDH